MVLQLPAGEQPETTRVEVATELVVRESSGPPGGAQPWDPAS
jgi:hypothetical protein